MHPRIPVTVLTGFLGAGKTTLVNRILAEAGGRRIGVIVNEMGEIGIDGELITSGEEELVELSNGCVCCTVRGDLVRTIRSLLTGPRPLDHLLIETTGIAAPGPVTQTFLVDPVLQQRTELDSITTLVDALNIEARLADSPEAEEQIAFADQIVLNKAAGVAGARLAAIERQVRAINPIAPILRAERAAVPVGELLGRHAFDLERLTELDPHLTSAACDAPGHEHGPDCAHGHDHEHHNDHGHEHGAGRLAGRHGSIGSLSLVSHRPMAQDKLEAWLTELITTRGNEILRGKGIFDVAGEGRRLVMQSVHMQLEGDFQRPWRDDEDRISKLVLIGRGLEPEELQAALEACAA